MSDTSYRAVWDRRSSDDLAALEAVDNSGSEAVAQATGQRAASAIAQAVALEPEDVVLELGCGAARIGRELVGRCGQYVGTDISPNMIRVASRRLAGYDNVRLEVLERTSLSMIANDSVDKAYSVAVLCHMDKEDLFLYLNEFARILKPGGLAYVETWNLADPVGWERWMYEVNYWQRADHSQRKDVARNQFCVAEEFQLYAERAGLDVLVCFRDSPWLQMVVGRDLDATSRKHHRLRLAEARSEIAYTPLFGQLFLDCIRVIYGDIHPLTALKSLEPMAGRPEAELYRIHIQGLWDQDPDRYGPPPESQGR
ncbi:MAG: class I SAM-dependent methyltransferase [Wenzhouxiangella sp.]|nr:class I SAM-dependent methyltransferase [Wenzhouxiangella sp.]MCH8476345.1 class I SAM-dependent methyltransferase [Wenzhouxiangella sp.]